MEKIPTTIFFGKKVLVVPDDITPKESANLAVALNLSLAQVVAGASQEQADQFLKDLGIERLFVNGQ